MKPLKLVMLGVILAASASSDFALASHGTPHFVARHGFAHHNWRHHPYWGPVFYGPSPWFYPWYFGYAIPVLPDRIETETAAPVEYVEMSSPPESGDAPSNTWYYCTNPQGYYPYIKTCTVEWQKIPAQPSK